MTKQELIAAVAAKTEKTQKDVKEIIAALEEVTLETIAKNDFIRFDFGKIGGKDVPAKTGRNPKTGDKIQIPAKTGYPYFKASKKAKE